MKIKEIINQHRRDFTAIYQCQHCNFEIKKDGYDDDYFHQQVIPKMKCENCGKIANDDYEPLKPKYHSSVTI